MTGISKISKANIKISLANANSAERDYEIHIDYGLLKKTGGLITPFIKNNRAIMIADENAFTHHRNVILESLQSAHIAYFLVTVKSGEASKSFENFARVCEEILEFGVERGDVLIAFGGGVVGDLTGFVAGVLNRGLDFIQIPTTLLSQVDSSVGGKTAINAKAGKNLVGLFWQPRLVIVDTQTLNSLDERDILSGFAEIFKIGLINNAEFFEYCVNNHKKILGENGAERMFAVESAIVAKAAIVEQDERETGVRALLNLGHTFAHAIEAAVNYDETKWRHGEAVAAGIAMAARFSSRIGILPKRDCDKILGFIKECGYRLNLGAEEGFNAHAMLETMKHDKKNQSGKIALILLRAIGDAYIERGIDENEILEFLKEECAKKAQNTIN